jgi:uncharacterized membrane protein
MTMIDIKHLVDPVITGIELAGFGVIVFGILGTTLQVLRRRLTGEIAWADAYFQIRRGNGRSLVLGLELLVAAEIIRSITAETLEAILLLAAVVIIRTFLAITVEMETEGHWPWERNDLRNDTPDSSADPPGD